MLNNTNQILTYCIKDYCFKEIEQNISCGTTGLPIRHVVTGIISFQNMELHQEYVDKILDLFLIISVMGAMKWIMIAIGGIVAATGLFFIMRKKNDETVITGSPPIALKSTGKPIKTEHITEKNSA